MKNEVSLGSIISSIRKEGKSTYTKRERVSLDLLATIQVAKKGSGNLFENLAVVNVEGVLYCINYDKVLPNGADFISISDNSKWYINRITAKEGEILCNGIVWYRSKRGYNLNPYSAIVTYCLLQGLDLIQEGYLEG